MRNALGRTILLIAGTSLFLLSVVAWCTRAQTNPALDDLGQALQNHGMDGVTAPVAAAAIEIAISNNNGFLTRLSNAEAAIASLQAAQPSSSGGAVIAVAANTFTASVPASLSFGQQPLTNATGVGGFIMPGITAGEQLIYSVSIPLTGKYALTVNASSSSIGSTMHVEVPAGTNASGEIAITPTGHSTICKPNEAPAVLALPQGAVIFTVVMETGGSVAYGGFTLRKVQ